MTTASGGTLPAPEATAGVGEGSACTACGAAGVPADARYCPFCGRRRVFVPVDPPPAPPAGLTVGDAVEIRDIVVLPNRRWGWWLTLVAAAAAGVVAAAFYTDRVSLHVGTRQHRVAPVVLPAVQHERAPAVVPPKSTAEPVVAPKPKSTRAQVRLVAAKSAWLQVRSGSAGGPVLYEGTLAGGSAKRFAAARVWIRFGWASNVELWANGKPVRGLSGTTAVLVTPTGVQKP